MKKEFPEPADALSRGKKLPFALVRCLSAVSLGPAPDELPTDELLEARFFSDTEEIRLFRDGGALRAAALSEEPGDELLTERFAVENPALGRAITVKKHIAFDDDGQAYIDAVRLSGWEGGEGNG